MRTENVGGKKIGKGSTFQCTIGEPCGPKQNSYLLCLFASVPLVSYLVPPLHICMVGKSPNVSCGPFVPSHSKCS